MWVTYKERYRLPIIVAFFSAGLLLFIGGYWLAASHHSEWYKTSCLVIASTVKNYHCEDNGNPFPRFCYYAWWNLSALDPNQTLLYGVTVGQKYSDIRQARSDMLYYSVGINYICYLQVGNNTVTYDFIWPDNPLLNVSEGITISAIIVAIGCLFILALCIVLLVLYIHSDIHNTTAVREEEEEDTPLK
jgi:hypothetical protein